ncbi:hypothetical protein BDFB_006316 [Asbolus verrucosus]|uniref:Homeotic protein Sex combs reduced n=1 Tax=Asbolus verrucosus TaxID=1661398 RepID=A0A482WCD5_ASBVE|nr:hypothetical protein BDFB_006316 [Asbolus verrucosus]
MSSYQFVNSLAQCYGQARAGGEQAPHQAASPGGDYYNPNAAATSTYPPACYSPPQVAPQYPQHPYATPAPGHGLQPTMGDYTQLQPQRLASGTASHLHHASPGAQSPGMLNPSASCKYADSTSSTGVASPQDLSTNPTRSTPPLPNNQASNATVTSKSSGLTSPLSVSTSPPGKPAASTASQNLSSPASSTSSTSSNEKSGSNNNNSKSGQSSSNPPQIYPWMKRVHLGQSKFNQSTNMT